MASETVARLRRKRPSELAAIAAELARGALQRRKFDRCGPWLRAAGRVRCTKRNGSIELGRGVLLWPNVKLSVVGEEGRAQVRIGDNTTVGDRTEIHSARMVSIGSDCSIAWDVVILDHDYHSLDAERDAARPVTVADGVWIGCRSLILKGVTLEPGSVVAAGSVVTQDVPANTLVGGNPARVLRREISWRR